MTRLLTAAVLLALAGATAATRLHAQDPSSPTRSPVLDELERALREAKKRLETARADADKQAQEAQSRIAEETKAVLTLREGEKKLSDKLRGLETELAAAETKAGAAAQAHETANRALEEARSALAGQSAELKERLAGSLITAQDEQLLDAAGKLRTNPNQALGEQVDIFFELYDRVLGYAKSYALVQIPVRVAEAGDRIENLKVLRLGMIGGYFSRPATSTGGLVLADPTARSGFVAESRGLTAAQKSAIFTLLSKPDRGGVIPVDVTGGAALAVARTSDSPLAWFRRGGFWMWPILAVAALAALIAIERTVTLTTQVFSVRKQARRVLALQRGGRASAAGQSLRGAAGRTFQAALDAQGQPAPVMEAAVQEALLRAEGTLDARLGLLSLAAGVAPLLGFLGTLAALAATFKLLGVQGYNQPGLLSGSIAEALIPTQAGLLVATGCLILRGLLGLLADHALLKIETSAFGLMAGLLRSEEEAASAIGGRL
jgi:biopolymer transport protein ExbB